ncbi:prolyl 4-hydroxylase subunit alpha-1 isoform X1 [Drosophila miranda]|uniref:prolyl 4-hydroxylase subunit alpha-1 isoform X1 n=1 Tax=Drosophila miranda TaxID=7229 RepID=UPI0007E6CB2E|nr:prolyl 4-hydroxylase subunit alpha-1 isoform X1 [Drosophila miranda]
MKMRFLFKLNLLVLLLHQNLAIEDTQMEDTEMIYSSSVLSMVKLLEMEDSLKDKLESYVQVMQIKLDSIKLFQQMLQRETMTTLEEREEFMGNPLNAFPLLRRLNQDWPKWLKYLRTAIATKTTNAMEKKLKSGPSNEDLQVALKGFARIESFYDQEAADMAKGDLLGQHFGSQLTAPDCFALADFHYNQTQFARCTPWYRTALRIHQSSEGKLYEKVLGLKRKKIYKKYAKALVMEAFYLAMPNKINPEWETLANQVAVEANYQSTKDAIDEYLAGDADILQQEAAKHKPKPSRLERGCRGQWQRKSSPPLACRYNQEYSAFLLLAPLKMEVLNQQPLIVLYHEVLYEKELRAMRDIANKNATMQDGWTRMHFDQRVKPEREDRVLKLHIFQGNSESFSPSINRRIADMTGLEVQGNNALHLSNYGLGGYFNAHYDYVDLTKRPVNPSLQANYFTEWGGDVLATVLLYASDVRLGGAVVFPKLKISVEPKKGNALIWDNLNNAGDPDKLSKHAVCPVVMGSRWTIYKWINEQQQMLKRPCLA